MLLLLTRAVSHCQGAGPRCRGQLEFGGRSLNFEEALAAKVQVGPALKVNGDIGFLAKGRSRSSGFLDIREAVR